MSCIRGTMGTRTQPPSFFNLLEWRTGREERQGVSSETLNVKGSQELCRESPSTVVGLKLFNEQ